MPVTDPLDGTQMPASTDAFNPNTQLATYQGGASPYHNHRIYANASDMNSDTLALDGWIGYTQDTDEFWGRRNGVWDALAPSNLVTSGTVTALSTFNIDGLTGFDRYAVTLNLPTSSTANSLAIRLRSSSTSNTATQYYRVRLTGNGSSATAATSSVSTSWGGLTFNNVTDKLLVLDLYSLNAEARTVGDLTALAMDSTSGELVTKMALFHKATTAFDGLEVIVSTGTVTGSYSVRGF